jgi:hypothetical protein
MAARTTALKLRMNDENYCTIVLLSKERWSRFLLRLVRNWNMPNFESAVSIAREHIDFDSCRACQVQKCLELGLIQVRQEFYECHIHGSQNMLRFPAETSIFAVKAMLMDRELPMKEEDWEVARIMRSVTRKLDDEFE